MRFISRFGTNFEWFGTFGYDSFGFKAFQSFEKIALSLLKRADKLNKPVF